MPDRYLKRCPRAAADTSTGRWSRYDTAADLGRVYSPETLITALESGDGGETVVSSSTKPDLMVRMRRPSTCTTDTGSSRSAPAPATTPPCSPTVSATSGPGVGDAFDDEYAVVRGGLPVGQCFLVGGAFVPGLGYA